MSDTRRGFLKRIGIAGAGAAAIPSVAANVGGGSWAVAGALRGGNPFGDSTPSWAIAGMGEAAWKLLRRRSDERERALQEVMQYRVAGLDPDLYQRVSGAHWWRCRIQMKRDRLVRREIQSMQQKLWPENW